MSCAASPAVTGPASAPAITPITRTATTPAFLAFQFILKIHLAVSLSVTSTPLGSAVQFMSQLTRDRFQMHEVTESRPCAFSSLVLSTARLTEVGYGSEFGINWSATEPAVVQVIDGLLGVLLLLELDIHVADKMVAKVVAHVHLLDLSVFILALNKHILKEVVVMLLHLLVRHVGQVGAIRRLGRVLRVDVQVLQQNSLREGWLIVDSGASVPVGAGAHLEVEGAVHLVLLRSKNTRQILRHFCCCLSLNVCSCRSESSNI